MKQIWKPGTMLYPTPVVLVSAATPDGKGNLITVAWTGVVNSEPPMVSISVRPERYSYGLIKESGEFIINLTTADMVRAVDYCGVRSGAAVDKFLETGLTREPASYVKAPAVAESPLNLECVVTETRDLGSHTLFIAEVKAVMADDRYLDEKGRLGLEDAGMLYYEHGLYRVAGRTLGSFGYSVRKKK